MEAARVATDRIKTYTTASVARKVASGTMAAEDNGGGRKTGDVEEKKTRCE